MKRPLTTVFDFLYQGQEGKPGKIGEAGKPGGKVGHVNLAFCRGEWFPAPQTDSVIKYLSCQT